MAKPKRKPSVLYGVMTLSAMAVISLFLGCLPSSNSRYQTRAAPVVVPDVEDPETAMAREKYEKNRMTPPRDYQVMPKPPRNNGFGEFEENLYHGLDAQPALPELPGDRAMTAGSGQTVMLAPASLSDTGFDRNAAPTMRRYENEFAPAMHPMGSARQPSPPIPAGFRTGSHFYPVEQLVYGGDYGELDKPDGYRLMPRDVISVTVRDHPEFSGQVTVQPDGTVRVPNSPDLIRVRGLTVDEAAATIRDTLAVYVRGECLVRVQANRARGGYYFVFGDVSQPGRFPMGMEPVKLSDAVMAANWEANPSRLDDEEDMGPAFPAASPRGKYMAPGSADMARVLLITPHRSQPVRTAHDLRQALMGMTGDDPAVRPGQIVVVPSLDPEKNRSFGLEMPSVGVPPAALMPGQGFSTAGSSPRLQEVTPPDMPMSGPPPRVSNVETNLADAFQQQHNTEPIKVQMFPDAWEYGIYGGEYCEGVSYPVTVESVNPAELPFSRSTYGDRATKQGNGGWNKGL